jgi:ParB-like chromosome segregation protein Spo0J
MLNPSENFEDTAGPEPVQHRLPHHPLASVFPMMSDDELAELMIADIEKRGLQDPIVLLEGQILDGRNRYAACVKLGIEPKTVEYDGDDAAAFVISKNLHRRHLTQAQKAEVVEKLLAAQPERSDRAIGRLAHVDHKTVAARRTELEDRGEIPHVETRSDTKGRSFPARRARDAGRASARSATGLAKARENREANAVLAFSQVLHEGDINRRLNDLLGLLRQEKTRITVLAESQREALARGFLDLLEISAEDLRPITGVPAFEGALH